LLKKTVSRILLTFILIGLVSLTFNIQRAKAAKITVPDDYSTIQAAINHANEGDTIFVRNGTYDEGLSLKKSLTIMAEGKINTIIERLNVSESKDVYLTNLCVNHLDVKNSTSIWAVGCRFPEVYVGSSAKLLMSQSEAWEIHTYDRGEILGFYDLPLFGRVVFSLPFGFIIYIFPLFLALAAATLLALVFIRRRKRQPSDIKQ
jgi:hypothetical protein